MIFLIYVKTHQRTSPPKKIPPTSFFNLLLFSLLVKNKEKMDSLFVVNIKLPLEYKHWIEDISKFLVLLVTVHVLLYITKQSNTQADGLFNHNFLKLLLFAIIGLTGYHLVFKKLIRFRFVDENVVPEQCAPYCFTFAPKLDRLREWLKNRL
jgi:hypothetical protein